MLSRASGSNAYDTECGRGVSNATQGDGPFGATMFCADQDDLMAALHFRG